MDSTTPPSVRTPNRALLLQPEDIIPLTADEAARNLDMFMAALNADEQSAPASTANDEK